QQRPALLAAFGRAGGRGGRSRPRAGAGGRGVRRRRAGPATVDAVAAVGGVGGVARGRGGRGVPAGRAAVAGGAGAGVGARARLTGRPRGARPRATRERSAFTSDTECHTLSLCSAARRTGHPCARRTAHRIPAQCRELTAWTTTHGSSFIMRPVSDRKSTRLNSSHVKIS